MAAAPASLLQALIRFDTTNPPGAEAACQAWIRDLLAGAGIESRLLASVPGRPNLVARVPGRGLAPPLLLQGHVDVVTTEGQQWRRPPFEGGLAGGWVWGRGALDMKGGLAMILAALLRGRAEGRPPAGDVILASVADEEAGGVHGAQFLVERHPGLFEGVRHGIGEGGGVNHFLAGACLYPVMVAEKRVCRLRAHLRGPAGHASLVHRGGTAARLGRLLVALDQARLPVHLTPIAEAHLRETAAAVPEPVRSRLLGMLDPDRVEVVLDELGQEAALYEAMLRHSANPTVVRAGHKINVIPSEASVDIDGRMLPGFGPGQFIDEVRAVVGPGVELEVLFEGPPMPEPELGPTYRLLGEILRELDPRAVPVPFLMPGATDQRHFAKLGIAGYGWLPLRLPPGFGQETVHAADERVPVAALEFGTDALSRLLDRYRG